MVKAAKILALFLLIIMIAIAGLWQTLPRWLPGLTAYWLPKGISLSLASVPLIDREKNTLAIPLFRLQVGDCALATVAGSEIRYQQKTWRLHIQNADIDNRCLSALPQTASEEKYLFQLDTLQQQLPSLSIMVERFSLVPWAEYAGKITLQNQNAEQSLNYQGENLSLALSLDKQQWLRISEFNLKTPDKLQALQLKGDIAVPLKFDSLPLEGKIQGELASDYYRYPLLLTLDWKAQQGMLTISERIIAKEPVQPLLNLPWQIDGHQLVINQGDWSWRGWEQPLSGKISLKLSDWDKGLSEASIASRLSVLTQGHYGKGNVVISMGPGKIGITNSDVDFQITGDMKRDTLVFSGSVPGKLSGTILSPLLTLKPGSLLRAYGKLSPEMMLEEVRWPLAGVNISASGINGRLQAITRLNDSYWGRIKMHLDGQAVNFFPDSGLWRWNYWGDGNLIPLQARWDIAGNGKWEDETITLTKLSSGLDQLRYGLVYIRNPRLALTSPVYWLKNEQKKQLGGSLRLVAETMHFEEAGMLPKAEMTLSVSGQSPENFNWNGALKTDEIGPIRLNGRWDGERLRGEAWWPKQPLIVFQTLLPPDTKWKIRSGELYAQAAFSAAQKQGFEAGGHWVVKNGGMWLQDGELSGLDFVLPYRLKDHRWSLGEKRPVTLRVKSLTNLFEMNNIKASLQGFYPYDDNAPLELTDISVDMLRGQVSLPYLRIPQRNPARLKIDKLELSELITALKPKQITMSGLIDGELPLYLDHPEWLVKDGWIANHNNLTLRLDQQMADEIIASNIAAGVAVDWLRYLEISDSKATVNLDILGNMFLNVHVKGMNPQKSSNQGINLNYTQQENIFQLWKSLRFGSNLQEWVEQSVSLPQRKTP